MNCKTSKLKWVTKGLKKSSKAKRMLRYKYYRNKTNENKITFKKYSTVLKKCINDLQTLNNLKHISNSNNKCKAVWDIVKRNMGNEVSREYIDKIVDSKFTATSGSDIANLFNNHFIDIVENNSSINNNTSHDNFKSNIINHSIFLEPTNEIEIYNIIKSLKNTRSSGYDNLTTKLIKRISPYISPPLAYVINLSLEQGCFPENLKLSVVKPLYKKGSKSDKNNYRPISLTPIIAKIFEKTVYRRLLRFFDKHDVLAKQQYGFRKNRSTAMATFNLVKSVVNKINLNIPTSVLFLDLSKAFDFVKHSRLIEKLNKCGIRGVALKWVESYLKQRKQVTRITKYNYINNTLETFDSSTRINSIGVPQGSILGPLLFLVYVNDFPQVLEKHDCILFADDTTIIIGHDKTNTHESQINKILQNIIEWLNKNSLNINVEKTKILNTGSYKSIPRHLTITLNNQQIEQIHNIKFLGITVDEHLTWKEHIDTICKKINKFVFALKKIREVTSIKTAIMVYHAYICSIIRYGIIAWGYSTDTTRVFIAQKKCLRAIFNMKWSESCRPVFKSENLLTVPNMFIYETAKFVKFNIHLFDINTNENKRKVTQSYLKMPVPRLEMFRRSCVYMAPLVFNSLPKEIVNQPYRKFCFT